MCLNVIKQIDFIDFSYGLACPNPAVLGSLAQTQNSLTCYSNKKFYRGNVMSGPFISLRAIKIINLIITTVWSYDMSHVGDVMTSFIITSLWVIITYLLDFFFINSISLFFIFLNFSFECDVVKKNESSLTRIFSRNAHASYSSFSAPFVSTNQNRVFRYGRHPGWMRRIREKEIEDFQKEEVMTH